MYVEKSDVHMFSVMFALSALLGEISSKSRIPMADILRRVENGIAQIPGATFLHVGIAVGKLSRLISGW